MEQRQLVGLITRRSGVRIPSPQPSRILPNPRSRPPRVLPFLAIPSGRFVPRQRGVPPPRRRGRPAGPRRRRLPNQARHGMSRPAPRPAAARPRRPAVRAAGQAAGRCRQDRDARNRPLATARVASARSVPARSSPRPANAPVPSRTAAINSTGFGRPEWRPAEEPGSDRQQERYLQYLERNDRAELRRDQLAAGKRCATEALEHAVVPLVRGGDAPGSRGRSRQWPARAPRAAGTRPARPPSPGCRATRRTPAPRPE